MLNKIQDWKLSDEMLCDIIPMDICHMLLDRPWQFDRHVVHDGHANTCTLTKERVKHKLKSLKEIDEKVCSATRVCVVDGRKLLDTMRHEHIHFSIIPKKGKEEVEEVPAEVVELLKEFPDLSRIMFLMDYHQYGRLVTRWI